MKKLQIYSGIFFDFEINFDDETKNLIDFSFFSKLEKFKISDIVLGHTLRRTSNKDALFVDIKDDKLAFVNNKQNYLKLGESYIFQIMRLRDRHKGIRLSQKIEFKEKNFSIIYYSTNSKFNIIAENVEIIKIEELYEILSRLSSFNKLSYFIKEKTLIKIKEFSKYEKKLDEIIDEIYQKSKEIQNLIFDFRKTAKKGEILNYSSIQKQEYSAIKSRDLNLKNLLYKEEFSNKSGSFIIEKSSALWSVDIDTNSEYKLDYGLNLDCNIRLIPEIFRVLSIKGASGIVMLDLLKVEKSKENELLSSIQKEIKKSNLDIMSYSLTKMGLLEVNIKYKKPDVYTLGSKEERIFEMRFLFELELCIFDFFEKENQEIKYLELSLSREYIPFLKKYQSYINKWKDKKNIKISLLESSFDNLSIREIDVVEYNKSSQKI